MSLVGTGGFHVYSKQFILTDPQLQSIHMPVFRQVLLYQGEIVILFNKIGELFSL